MPLFNYRCAKCQHEEEHLVKRDESDAPQKCEECSGPLEKQISVSSFQLKGGGWFKDLYSSSKPAKGKE